MRPKGGGRVWCRGFFYWRPRVPFLPYKVLVCFDHMYYIFLTRGSSTMIMISVKKFKEKGISSSKEFKLEYRKKSVWYPQVKHHFHLGPPKKLVLQRDAGTPPPFRVPSHHNLSFCTGHITPLLVGFLFKSKFAVSVLIIIELHVY